MTIVFQSHGIPCGGVIFCEGEGFKVIIVLSL